MSELLLSVKDGIVPLASNGSADICMTVEESTIAYINEVVYDIGSKYQANPPANGITCNIKRMKGQNSPSGNRTPVSRVTGGDTHHYTNEEDTY